MGVAAGMSGAVTVLLASVGAVAAILGVLLPVIVAQGRSLRREMDARMDALTARVDLIRADLTARVDALTARMDALTVRVDSVSERVARIEGALTGPWRPPTNGNPPAPAPSSTPPTAAP